MRVPSIYASAGALLLLCGYTAAIAVMSVDLGSEWMKVAVVSPGVPMEIALNPASKRKTAVAVSIKDGERMFGADALVQGVKSPRHCYKYLLDLLGKKFDHPLVARFQAQNPFYTLVADPVRGTVLFKHDEETMYSPEELLGMILFHAKGQAESFTEQKVKDVVITAPIYFNQAERQALVAAAELGGLNVLQLINVPSAVALNYGMFRRKEINGTVKNLMFYDMGAADTTAVVVGFQIVKTKERGFTETHPQAQILGVGYDRTLGGTEISLRLRKYLADEFNKMGKTKTDVTTVPRAMAKLYKEADRVKTILSANTDFYAQIENVMEDIDFKHQVTRDKLLELCSDMMERVTVPVDNALKTAAMSIDEIDQLIVVGGGTRVPKVQELLVNTFKKELGKNLNADEAAAMGAVYKAADLSTGFKVKKFITKDAVVFPIDVDFEREYETEAGEKGVKKVKRTLFSRMNPYPQKKIMTFNKHVKDFKFNVFYEDLAYLGEAESSYVGSSNVSTVEVKGVTEALEKNKGDNVETKGVKAHFFLDDSGILSCTTIESVFEKTISPEEQEKAEKEGKKDDDSWAKLGSTISRFFSGDKKEGEEGKGAEEAEGKDPKKENDEKKDSDKEKKPKGEKYDSKEGAPKKDKKEDEKKKEEEKKDKEPKKPKIETIKEELSQDLKRVDTIILEGDSFAASKKKLEDLDKADQERHEHETALNELQSFVYDMQDKLYMEEYESASTDEEKEKIKTLCSETSEWLDEEAGPFTPTQEFKDKLKALKELTSALFARVREHSERPEALKDLRKEVSSRPDGRKSCAPTHRPAEVVDENGMPYTTGQIAAHEPWSPTPYTAFKVLLSARLCAAIWSGISDCDETYNYWEPVHQLLYGTGLQTWEYEPRFALRSYLYLLVHAVPGWIYARVLQPNPMLVFYFLRCLFGFVCALSEVYFYRGVLREFGANVGRLTLCILVFSAGMFVSSTAFLPSTSSMYLTLLSVGAWFNQQYKLAIFFTALSTFLSWPFAALIGAPIAIDILFLKKRYQMFMNWCIISAATILCPQLLCDTYYYGKPVFASLNIVWYNVFTSHGPDLYGTEPASFYLFNGILNFNFVFIFAILVLPVQVVSRYMLRGEIGIFLPDWISQAPLYLWLLVFWTRPHKEERFLFPIYPLICLAAAMVIDSLQKMWYFLFVRVKSNHFLHHTAWLGLVALGLTAVISLSRITALYQGYHAATDVWMKVNQIPMADGVELPSGLTTVCMGKEWYRYPSSFFLPGPTWRVGFLRSEFRGQLPKYFPTSTADGQMATRVSSKDFNDMNNEEPGRYINPAKCHFIVDLDNGEETERQPRYVGQSSWSVVEEFDFLDSGSSHPLFRAFYVPFVSHKACKFNKYVLLKRVNQRRGKEDT